MIKCTCGDPNCKTGISFDRDGLYLHTKDGQEALMYVDANTIVALIHELKKMLIDMAWRLE